MPCCSCRKRLRSVSQDQAVRAEVSKSSGDFFDSGNGHRAYERQRAWGSQRMISQETADVFSVENFLLFTAGEECKFGIAKTCESSECSLNAIEMIVFCAMQAWGLEGGADSSHCKLGQVEIELQRSGMTDAPNHNPANTTGVQNSHNRLLAELFQKKFVHFVA